MIEGQEDVTWEDWVAIAACERSGIGTLFRSDHYLSVEDKRERGSLDAWSTIAALGAVTSSLRLGTMVSPATFRHPSVLAKLSVSADQISGGRVELGIGAGWWDREHAAYGFDLPPVGPRMDAKEEQMRIAPATGPGEFSFDGEHYKVVELDALPKPVQRPAADHARRQRRAAQPAPRGRAGRRVQHRLPRRRGDRRAARPSSTPSASARAATRRRCRCR